jgi:RsiW-degrading membrane proteinase PrsW (M82 family)
MTLPAILFLSFLSIIICAAYCLVTQQLDFSLVGFAVLLGLAAVACASILQALLNPITSSLRGFSVTIFRSFVESALVEESVKFLAVLALPGIRTRRFSLRQIFSGALLLAVSFSAFETFAYSLRSPSAVFLRFFTSLPVHASVSLVGGSLIGSLVFRAESDVRIACAFAFVSAVALHGAFNLFMDLSGGFIVLGILCVGALVAQAVAAWRRVKESAR